MDKKFGYVHMTKLKLVNMKKIGLVLLLIAVMSGVASARQVYYDALASGLKGNVRMEKSLGMTTNWNNDGSMVGMSVKRDARNRAVELGSNGWYMIVTYGQDDRIDEVRQYTGNTLSQTEKYYYDKPSDFLPSKIKVTYYDGTSVEQTYKYLEIDSHGNWTKCTVQDNGRKPSTRQRVIEYWE